MMKFILTFAVLALLGAPVYATDAAAPKNPGMAHFYESEKKKEVPLKRMELVLSGVKDRASADVAAKEFTEALEELVRLSEAFGRSMAAADMDGPQLKEMLKKVEESRNAQREVMARIEKRSTELCAKKCYGSDKLQNVLVDLFCIGNPEEVPQVIPLPKD